MRFERTRPGVRQHPHVFADVAGVTPSFSAISNAADAVLDEVAVDLRAEMRARVLEPFENLQAALVGKRFQDIDLLHSGILPSY